jgi:NAD(P)-dependent dehydrogenase (short-subunit alcohol dehydrogenase family)
MGDLTMRLKQQIALVTGGSRSIGREIALGYAGEGADVAVNYVQDTDAAQNTVRKIEALGRRALAVKADTSNPEEVAVMVNEVWETLGPIDILVNNAGVQKRIFFLDLKEADWDRILGVNLKGCYLVGQAVAARMKQRGGGKIINITSEAAGFPAQRMTAYCVSKAGVAMLTRCMALELAAHGIRVNALAPGLTKTDINRKDLEDEEFLQMRLSRIPLGRVMTPEDLVGAAVFLASSDSNMATGVTVQVDGGRSIA